MSVERKYEEKYLRDFDEIITWETPDWQWWTEDWCEAQKEIVYEARRVPSEERQDRAYETYLMARQVVDDDLRHELEFTTLIWNLPDHCLDEIITAFEKGE